MKKILANISASLAAPKNLDQVIASALEGIGKFIDISRVYMMEVRMSENLIDNTYEWCAPGVASRKNKLWGIPLDSLPKWMEPLKKNANIVIPDVKNDSFEGAASPFASSQIRALLMIPLWTNGQLHGFIGLEDLSHSLYWREEHIHSLQMIAEIFKRSIRAHQIEEELRKTKDQQDQRPIRSCI